MSRKINSKEDVINLATDCFKKYVNEMGWKNPEDVVIKIQGVYESVIYPEDEFSLITDMDLGAKGKHKILGKTIMDDKVILIDKSISSSSKDPRFTFTFGHEIGHSIMHQNEQQLFRCTDNTIYNANNLLEIQANWFAEHLIMPHGLVVYRYKQYYETNKSYRYIGEGRYYINNRDVYINSIGHLCYKLAEPLTPYFSNVSKESLGYVMSNAGVIRNETNEKVKYPGVCVKKGIRNINEIMGDILLS